MFGGFCVFCDIVWGGFFGGFWVCGGWGLENGVCVCILFLWVLGCGGCIFSFLVGVRGGWGWTDVFPARTRHSPFPGKSSAWRTIPLAGRQKGTEIRSKGENLGKLGPKES